MFKRIFTVGLVVMSASAFSIGGSAANGNCLYKLSNGQPRSAQCGMVGSGEGGAAGCATEMCIASVTCDSNGGCTVTTGAGVMSGKTDKITKKKDAKHAP